MTALYKPRPERWLQVSLRGLFVLVTILGVFLGWLGVQVKWIRDRHEALEWVRQHEHPMAFQAVEPKPMPWSLRMFGEAPTRYITIQVPKGEKAARVRELEELFPECHVLATEQQSESP
jgi:hypothetical protein